MSSFISGNLIHFIFSNWVLCCKLTECLFISSIFKLKNVHGKDCSKELFEWPESPMSSKWLSPPYIIYVSALDLIVFKCISSLKYVPQYFLQIYFRLCNKTKSSCPAEWTLVPETILRLLVRGHFCSLKQWDINSHAFFPEMPQL